MLCFAAFFALVIKKVDEDDFHNVAFSDSSPGKKKKNRLHNIICNVFVYTAGTDSVFCSQMKAGTSREWRSTGVSMNHRFLQTWRG